MSTDKAPALHIRLITLAFRPTLGGFETAPLDQFLVGKELLAMREYLIDAQGVPHLLCVLTYREAAAPEPASTPPTVPRGRPRAREVTPPAVELTPIEAERFARLRAWRSARARRDGMPPYILFHDRELAELARRNPESLAALGTLRGVGPGKLSRFGEEVLAALAGDTQQQPQLPASASAPS